MNRRKKTTLKGNQARVGASGEKPQMTALFPNSLRTWQQRWKAQQAATDTGEPEAATASEPTPTKPR